MTTIAVSDEARSKLGKVNKYFNYKNNESKSLGDTIEQICDSVIKNHKIA